MKNTSLPNNSLNERRKMVAPAHNHTETTETSITHAVDGDRFYTAPRWAPVDMWLTSSCTRVIIWSILDLSVTSYSSGFSTKLLMQGATHRMTVLERDLFCVASTGVFIHTFPVVSPAAIIFYFTYFTVHARVSCSPTSTSGELGNDYLTASSSASQAWNKLN